VIDASLQDFPLQILASSECQRGVGCGVINFYFHVSSIKNSKLKN
jgi:hypothetical protein